jgi:hypothetical protein
MAVTFGMAGGTTLFVATVWLLIRGGESVGEHLALLNHFFPGYSVTWLGAPIGFCYGALVGAAAGWTLAKVYNAIAGRRDPNGAPGPDEAPRGAQANRVTTKTGFVLIALLAIGVLLRIAHWDHGFASDDSNYMNYAAQMLQGEIPPRNIHSVRLGYVSFLAAGMGLSSASTIACQSLGIFVFIGTAILLFITTRRLSGASEGLLAVFLFVWFPLDIARSTSVFPDTLMTLLVLAASLLYLHAKTQLTDARQFLLASAAGFVLGSAVSVKEPAVIAGLAFAVDLLATTRDRRAIVLMAGMAVGGAAALSLEVLGFLAWTEDPLFRTQTVLTHVASDGSRRWTNPFSLYAATYYLRLGANSLGEFGIHCYLLLVGALLAANRRSRSVAFPLILCGVLAAYYSVGSMSLSRYVQMWHAPRYFHVVVVIGCVFTAVELCALVRRQNLKPYVAVAAGVVFAGICLQAAKEIDWRGSVPVAKWLGELDENRKAELVILEDFARRQALENRQAVAGFPTIPNDATRSPSVVAGRLAGRGLVVDRFEFGRGDLQEMEMALTADSQVAFRYEEIRGDSWPPYKRWIGVGEQESVLGRIWWLAPATEPIRSRGSGGGR